MLKPGVVVLGDSLDSPPLQTQTEEECGNVSL